MTKNNKLNLISISIIAILGFVINQRTAIYQCAAIFTAIFFIATLPLINGNLKKAYQQFLLGIVMSLPLYSVIGSVFSTKLVLVSLASISLIGCVSIYITHSLSKTMSFAIALCIALIFAAVLDGIIMRLYFTMGNVFTLEKIIRIFNKELFFKILYGVSISTIIYLVDLYKKHRQSSY